MYTLLDFSTSKMTSSLLKVLEEDRNSLKATMMTQASRESEKNYLLSCKSLTSGMSWSFQPSEKEIRSSKSTQKTTFRWLSAQNSFLVLCMRKQSIPRVKTSFSTKILLKSNQQNNDSSRSQLNPLAKSKDRFQTLITLENNL